MKVHVCDICGEVITNPYKMKMRQFFIGAGFEVFGIVPVAARETKKIEVCDRCYNAIKNASIPSPTISNPNFTPPAERKN